MQNRKILLLCAALLLGIALHAKSVPVRPAEAGSCPAECLQRTCTAWYADGELMFSGETCQAGDSPWGGCCRRYGAACQPGCGDTADPGSASVNQAPSLSATISGVAGMNGWLVDDGKLNIVTSDPDGDLRSIRVQMGEQTVSCQNQCSLDLPEGAGVAVISVSDGQGGAASDTVAYQYDSIPPSAPEVVFTGVMGPDGYYITGGVVTATAVDASSGIASVTLAGDPSYTITDSSPAAYRFDMRARDLAGLASSASGVVAINMAYTPPSDNVPTVRSQNIAAGMNAEYTGRCDISGTEVTCGDRDISVSGKLPYFEVYSHPEIGVAGVPYVVGGYWNYQDIKEWKTEPYRYLTEVTHVVQGDLSYVGAVQIRTKFKTIQMRISSDPIYNGIRWRDCPLGDDGVRNVLVSDAMGVLTSTTPSKDKNPATIGTFHLFEFTGSWTEPFFLKGDLFTDHMKDSKNRGAFERTDYEKAKNMLASESYASDLADAQGIDKGSYCIGGRAQHQNYWAAWSHRSSLNGPGTYRDFPAFQMGFESLWFVYSAMGHRGIEKEEVTRMGTCPVYDEWGHLIGREPCKFTKITILEKPTITGDGEGLTFQNPWMASAGTFKFLEGGIVDGRPGSETGRRSYDDWFNLVFLQSQPLLRNAP